VVLAAAQYASKPEIHAVFERLPQELFDIRHLDRLSDLGWAAWYANARYNELLSRKTKRVVPPDLVQRVRVRKQRMLRVAQYHLQDDPIASVSLRAIGKSRSYVQIASDLTVLSRLYNDHKEQIAGDSKWYREADAREAEEDAAALLCCVSAGPDNETKNAVELLTRIFIVIRDSYEKVRAAACFAFGKNAQHLESFPVLHTAVRRAAKTTKKPVLEAVNDE